MRIGPHHHPCFHCKEKTECCGEIEQNYDGFPEWVCVEYHVNHRHFDFFCESCLEKREHGECENCGAFYSEPHDKNCEFQGVVSAQHQ